MLHAKHPPAPVAPPKPRSSAIGHTRSPTADLQAATRGGSTRAAVTMMETAGILTRSSGSLVNDGTLSASVHMAAAFARRRRRASISGVEVCVC